MSVSAPATGGAGERRPRGPGGNPDARLPRSRRLLESRLFQEAFEQERKFPGRYMVLVLRAGEGANLRLGVITSRRTLRRSVDRSRARRLLREAFRLNRHALAPGIDIVLIARRAILGVRRQQVDQDLLALARRARILGGTGSERRQNGTLTAGGRRDASVAPPVVPVPEPVWRAPPRGPANPGQG